MWVWFWSWWPWGLKVSKKRQFFRICWPARSSSLFGRFYFMHSLRSKILHRSIKKMSENFWKWKKLEQLFENFWDFFRSKKNRFFRKVSLEFVWKWKNLRSKNFEIFRSKKFQKFSLEIEWKWKFSRSKIFDFFI